MKTIPEQALNPGVQKREVFGWAMYDFANSGYTTVVLTAVFAAYFVGGVAGGAEWATFAWTAALSVSYAIVMLTMFVIITWKYFGFHMILLLAGLQGIPRELEEAAAIDGASRWQSIRRITLPLLGPTIRVSIFLSIIGSLQLFDLVWVTTRGGPVNASNTMATYMIDWGFRRSQLGYGSAAAVILFLLALVLALIYQRWVMRRDIDGALTNAPG